MLLPLFQPAGPFLGSAKPMPPRLSIAWRVPDPPAVATAGSANDSRRRILYLDLTRKTALCKS
jgi:hypothetical protein